MRSTSSSRRSMGASPLEGGTRVPARSGMVTAESWDAMIAIVRAGRAFSLEYAPAVSGPPAVELAWSRGAGADACIDAGELAAKVGATIGRPVRVLAGDDAGAPAGDAGPLRLDGQVLPLGSGWIAVVEVRTAGPTLRREVTLDARGLPPARRGHRARRGPHGGGGGPERPPADPSGTPRLGVGRHRARRRRLLGDAARSRRGLRARDRGRAGPLSGIWPSGHTPGRSPRASTRSRTPAAVSRPGSSAPGRASAPPRAPASPSSAAWAPPEEWSTRAESASTCRTPAPGPISRGRCAWASGCGSPVRCSCAWKPDWGSPSPGIPTCSRAPTAP